MERKVVEKRSDELRKILFKEMKRQNISKEQLSEMTGIHCNTFYKWSHGKGMNIDTLDRAMKALDITAVIGKE